MYRLMTLFFLRPFSVFLRNYVFSARSRQIFDKLTFPGLWLEPHEKVNMDVAIFRSDDKNIVHLMSIYVTKPSLLTPTWTQRPRLRKMRLSASKMRPRRLPRLSQDAPKTAKKAPERPLAVFAGFLEDV